MIVRAEIIITIIIINWYCFRVCENNVKFVTINVWKWYGYKRPFLSGPSKNIQMLCHKYEISPKCNMHLASEWTNATRVSYSYQKHALSQTASTSLQCTRAITLSNRNGTKTTGDAMPTREGERVTQIADDTLRNVRKTSQTFATYTQSLGNSTTLAFACIYSSKFRWRSQ